VEPRKCYFYFAVSTKSQAISQSINAIIKNDFQGNKLGFFRCFFCNTDFSPAELVQMDIIAKRKQQPYAQKSFPQ
jgi:hypothetical protein